MPTELPHALLNCSECGTSFKLTLKKGRPPSKPVPCPKCKAPITVTEDHIVEPGNKTASAPEGGALRQTRPGELVATKLVNPNDIPVEDMMDPPSAEVPVDPPTAEVDVVALAEAEEEDEQAPAPVPASADATPAFGIVRQKKIQPRDPNEEPKKGGLVGVDVVKTKGRAARDNVYGQRKAGSLPLGRIGGSRTPAKTVQADDDSLPAVVDSKPKIPKLNLDKLRKAISKVDVSDVSDDEFEKPLTDFGPDIEESEISEPDFDELPSLAEDSDSIPADDLGAEGDGDDPPDDRGDEPEGDDGEDHDDEQPDVEDAEPDRLDASDAATAEPAVVTLDVEDSEGYELGDADVPARAETPERKSPIGAIIGVFILVLIIGALIVAIS